VSEPLFQNEGVRVKRVRDRVRLLVCATCGAKAEVWTAPYFVVAVCAACGTEACIADG
jgi:hypothetical protein